MPDRAAYVQNVQAQQNAQQAQPTKNPDGSPVGSDAYAGSSFGADSDRGVANGVGGTNVAGLLKDADPRDFMYGRDPNYVNNTAAAERNQASILSNDIYQQGQAAQNSNVASGQNIANYGQQAAANGQSFADTLYNNANSVYNQAAGLQGRQGAQANFQQQNSALQAAKNYNGALAGMNTDVSSGAQAQLQSGLNQSEASNLALARSGHGFGASSSALNQAVSANAAAGQQATNQAALLQAQTDQAAIAQKSQNLANAGNTQGSLAAQYGQQATTNAQLQNQTMAENDQAQAALYGQSLGAQNSAMQGYNAASGMGLQGLTSGQQAALAGQTLGMQGTQQAMGIYGQGEQMAGLNMSAQQQSDLARESGLLTQQGIDAGLAVSNQAAINSGWGTALSTAGTIGAATATALSDASAKTNVQALDKTPQAPASGSTGASSLAAPVGQAAGAALGSAVAPGLGSVVGGAAGGLAGSAISNGAKPPAQKQSMAAPALQAGGAVLGGAIGSAIAPGIGTALGGIAGSIAGSALGHLVASDVATKQNSAPLDAPQLGYGQTNPSGSTQAGAANAYTPGREAAAAADSKAAYDSDLHDQAQTAAMNSMIAGAGQNLGNFAKTAGSIQFHPMGGPAPAVSPVPGSSWGSWAQPGMVTSDVHSKRHIEALHKENQQLKAQLAPQGPTQEQLNQAYLDQSPGLKIQYAPDVSAPTQEQLNAAAMQQYETSDEDAKTNIQRSAATDMVESAPGYAYDYIEPERHGYGRNYGPMAQDLASTPAGASTVRRMPDGKLGVDTNRLSLVNTAALHTHQEELKRLRSDIDRLKGDKGDAKLSKDLDAIDDRYTSGLSGGNASDVALSRQLDAADQAYSVPIASAAPTVMPTVVQPSAVPTARFADVPTQAPSQAAPSYLIADGADLDPGGGINGRYGAAPDVQHHFWEVPNYQTGGYVPFWQLPAEGYAPAQQTQEKGRHLFGRG